MPSKTKLEGDPYESLQVEDHVKHPKFGEGQIIQRSGSGEQTKFLVAFNEEGEKLLLGRYAKLKKIRPMEDSSKQHGDEASQRPARDVAADEDDDEE